MKTLLLALSISSLHAVALTLIQSPKNGISTDLKQPYRLDLFTDVLVWSAAESGHENWARVATGSAAQDVDNRAVSFGWDPGFRVGIDYSLKSDQWDTMLSYTWFPTEGKDHIASAGPIASSFIGNYYVGNSLGVADSGPAYHEASIQWNILLQVLDWELGRKYTPSESLSFRTFFGLKGAMIDQSIHSQWKDPIIPIPISLGTATENIKNDYWGIGPSAGCNAKWTVATFPKSSLSLFGDFSGALLWGHWSLDDVYKNAVPQTVSVNEPDTTGGSTMLRAFTGLGWEAHWMKERYRFAIRAGYEGQFWFDQLQFTSFNTGRFNNLLTLQGITLDLHLDF